MDSVLSDLKLTRVLVYLDDVNVYYRTFNEHLKDLEKAFNWLAGANLKLKKKKCTFFKEQLDYLEFLIDKNGLHPQPNKVSAIENMKIPEDKKDIQVFLGMVGYYCQFINNFSYIGELLFYLLKKDSAFIWNQECQVAFNYLCTCLMTAPVLHYPDFTRKFSLKTDASHSAIGALLSQIADDNKEHPVAYCSQTFNSHECNYTEIKCECLAIIFACKQFCV